MQLSHQHLFIVALLFSVFLFQLCFFKPCKGSWIASLKAYRSTLKISQFNIFSQLDVIGAIQTSLKADIKPLQEKNNADTVAPMLQKFHFYRNWTIFTLKKKKRVGVVASRCAGEIYLKDLWNIYMSGNCFFIVALHQFEMHRHRLLRGSPEFAFPVYYLRTLWLHVAGPWGAWRRDCKPISDRIAPCRLSLILQVWGERGGSSGCTAQVLSNTLIQPAVDTHCGRFPLGPKATDASLFPFRCSWS